MKNSTVSNVSNYFYSLLQYKESSPTEMQNFINNFTKFIFDYEGVDYNNYEINTHIIKDAGNYLAYMQQDEKYNNKFDVYFVKTDLKVENFNQVPQLMKFILTIGHEIAHVIQYIKHPKAMKKDDEEQIKLNTILEQSTSYNLYKKAVRYQEMCDYLSRFELNADMRSAEYCRALLESIYYASDDESFKDFICNCSYLLEHFIKCRKKETKFARKVYRDVPQYFADELNKAENNFID